MTNPVWDLLEARVRSLPSEPVITAYDVAGARTELSARTLANAVAKAANALLDEAGVEPGQGIELGLPWHWQLPVWSLAAWTVGARIEGTDDLVLHVRADDAIDSAGADDWIVSLHPFGLPVAGLPQHLIDASSLVRLQPDAFLAPDVDEPQALARARELALHASVTPGERIALGPVEGADAAIWSALVPLVADTRIVLVADVAQLEHCARIEGARVVSPSA